jgi:hypothetical protein
MIHEARPKACRDFPHVSIGKCSLGSRQSLLARWAPLCPIIFNALEAYKHLTGYDRHAQFSTISRRRILNNSEFQPSSGLASIFHELMDRLKEPTLVNRRIQVLAKLALRTDEMPPT